jgi:hypothetical protein
LDALAKMGKCDQAMVLVREFELTNGDSRLISTLCRTLIDKGMLAEAWEVIVKRRKARRKTSTRTYSWPCKNECEMLARGCLRRRDFNAAEWLWYLTTDKEPVITEESRMALRMEMAIYCIIKGEHAQADNILYQIETDKPTEIPQPGTPPSKIVDPGGYIVKELRYPQPPKSPEPRYPGMMLSSSPWIQMHIAFRLTSDAPAEAVDKWLARLTDVKEQVCFNLGRRHGRWVKANSKPDMTTLWTGP